jgi:indole-3-glycerol phosphate synthase
MSDILQTIVARKREEVAALKRAHPLAALRDQAAARPPALDFAGALRGPRPRGAVGAPVHIIAELKRRSPSKGVFPWHGDVERQVRAYERGGAKAVSVVTDGPFFGGSPALLGQVKAAVTLPVLQKEFLLEPVQALYARALGADACLLIAAILPGGLLEEMIGAVREAGLGALVEVTGEAELERAARAGAVVIGVNNRDLRTFTLDTARTERLLPRYRDDQVCIAESGIHTPEDIARLLTAGVDGFLIGEALMTAPDPEAHLRRLRGVAPAQPAQVDQPQPARRGNARLGGAR